MLTGRDSDYMEYKLFGDLPDGAMGTVGDMQDNRDGDGTLSPQRSHGPLGLDLVAGGFYPGAAQVGQLAELNTVFLRSGHRGNSEASVVGVVVLSCILEP